jgi:hypothetical protein
VLSGHAVQSHKRKGAGHAGKATILGLDVHAETIAVAIAMPRSWGAVIDPEI